MKYYNKNFLINYILYNINFSNINKYNIIVNFKKLLSLEI